MSANLRLSGPLGYHQRKPTVDLRLSQTWNCRPSTAHARLWGHDNLVKLMLDVVNTHRELGEHARLAHWVNPLEAVLSHADATLCDLLIIEAIEADYNEDVARERFLLDRNHETRRAWLKCISPERSTKLRLSHALRQEDL